MSQAISGVGQGAASFGIERLGRVLSMQKNAMVEAGQQALTLIKSAAMLPPGQGENLDVKA